jgi:hypothetical protein
MNNSANAARTAGNPTSPRMDVTIMFHVKIGTRHIVIPGARRKNTVVRMFSPDSNVETATRPTPRIHRSGPTPGDHRASESGG